MTKKDYELIAQAITATNAEFARQGEDASPYLAELAENLATMLEGDNPRFNHSTFLKACGVNI